MNQRQNVAQGGRPWEEVELGSGKPLKRATETRAKFLSPLSGASLLSFLLIPTAHAVGYILPPAGAGWMKLFHVAAV